MKKCNKCKKEGLKIYYSGICPKCYYTNTNVNSICGTCNKQIQLYSNKTNQCRKCYMDKFNKKNYNINKENIKKQTIKYYTENKDKCLKRYKKYAEKNKEVLTEYNKKYYEENKERLQKINTENYRKNSKERNKNYYQNYRKPKLKNDLEYYIKDRLSTRIRMAIMCHKGTKVTSSIELLGDDIDTVRLHLEKQFTEGMSWANHGEWHIDHIIPCDSFDLKNIEEQKKCFHYTNLQPLWGIDNIRKSTKILE